MLTRRMLFRVARLTGPDGKFDIPKGRDTIRIKPRILAEDKDRSGPAKPHSNNCKEK